jgi:hypothetical protein
MATKVSDRDWHEWQERQFVSASIQYYVAARGSAIAGFMPVSGNLFHHAFEMLLKTGIIRRNAAVNTNSDCNRTGRCTP